MKRYITTMLALCIGVCVLNAQEKSRFTPQKGTWTVGAAFVRSGPHPLARERERQAQ